MTAPLKRNEDIIIDLSSDNSEERGSNCTRRNGRQKSTYDIDPDYRSSRPINLKTRALLRAPRRSRRVSCNGFNNEENEYTSEATTSVASVLGVPGSRRGSGKRRGRPPKRRGGFKEREMLTMRVPRKSRGRRGRVQPSWSPYGTILSWLIESNAIHENDRVWYVNPHTRQAMLEGFAARAGITCSCCNKVHTVSDFEAHGANGWPHGKPYRCIYVGDPGVSLLSCQARAWAQEEEWAQRGYRKIERLEGAVDDNDDTCVWCGDGGNLICCEGCPATIHENCIDLQMVPQGNWFCPHCYCKFCKESGYLALSCSQCLKNYHWNCRRVKGDPHCSLPPFCEEDCKQIFRSLQQLVGVANVVGEEGLTWTLVRPMDIAPILEEHTDLYYGTLQLNSKIAVAWSVMEESFMPIIDDHTRINVIKSVVFSCGSNFTRINFSRFYTAILERGDEIISAATLRIHGKRFAEMPFIATREKYRHRGMCRTLMGAIELALRDIGVENLVIPSIPKRVDSWKLYGFDHLEDDLKKEMMECNSLMFPQAVRLQKKLQTLPATGAEGARHSNPMVQGYAGSKPPQIDLNVIPLDEE